MGGIGKPNRNRVGGSARSEPVNQRREGGTDANGDERVRERALMTTEEAAEPFDPIGSECERDE